MRSNHFLQIFSLLIISSVLLADTSLIRTTVSDSSRVVFIAQTPVFWERVEQDNLEFIRFTGSPVTDSIGYPELPMITCLIAMPDSVTPKLDFAWAGLQERHVDPVYPAPAQVISYEYTPAVVDSFVQDSTAYASASFWPSEMARVIGEMRICGQRLLKVQLFPARYRASDSTLVTVSSISASLSFDSTEAVWSSIGLGAFQDLLDDSPIVGYHRTLSSVAPVPTYFGQVDPYTGPLRMPDYVIICASGLYDQCQDAIDDLAEHRVELNDFDVALVTTDDIFDDFGQGQLALTDYTIREFTEHMWNNWTQTSGKKPSYLLLIGDHEEADYSDEPWFLPTHEYLYNSEVDFMIGNDEWYVYFDELQSVDNAMPSMFVGRLSVKNGGEHAPDTLSTLIQNLIDLEQPITSQPITDYRRRILRLAGTGDHILGVFHQNFGTNNKPLEPWTSGFADWMSYDFVSHYCGDGRWFTNEESDESPMKSSEWVQHCITEFGRGAGVAFYTDHGDLHMFSAGLEWCDLFYDRDDTKGCRDSTFNNYQIEQHLTGTVQGYSAPFSLLLCCSAGTFNHTLYEHEHRDPDNDPYFCLYDDQGTTMPYNFSSDCLAERMLKNTNVPVAGVFCGSQPSAMGCYEYYGQGILEAIYARGHGRLGDAIASARAQFIDHFFLSTGDGTTMLGQFNLLGDPALDISDRVRYPDKSDLSIYGGEIVVSQYPEETSTGLDLPLVFRVRNNGAQDSDECDIRITFRNGANTFTDYIECDPIDGGGYQDFQYTWDCSRWFQPPMDLTVSVEVDYEEVCDDCWWPNNDASVTVGFNDTYPVLGGWIRLVDEVVSTTPVLANIDNDLDLEVIVLVGNTLTAFEEDGAEIWSVVGEGFSSSIQILASDLGNDGETEFILASDDGIKVVSADGDVLQTIQLATGVFCVGEMESTLGLELCAAVGNTLHLYTWNSLSQSFSANSTKQLSLPDAPIEYSLACADLDSNYYADVVYCCGYSISAPPPETGYNALVVYDWETGGTPFVHTRSEPGLPVTPAAGRLGGEDLVGYPYRKYEYRLDNPALIVEPDGIIEEECEAGTCDADNLRYGVFADWDPLVPGADTFVLPSEMQALAWGNDGLLLNDWPTEEFFGAIINSPISPTALGNINNSGYADVVFSTLLDGKCILLAYESSSNPPANSDFPLTLPDDVTSFGGFSIADIDRDGVVEMVFGTSDGYLHCWELGACSSGYAPWHQFQHDCGRTGVLQ